MVIVIPVNINNAIYDLLSSSERCVQNFVPKHILHARNIHSSLHQQFGKRPPLLSFQEYRKLEIQHHSF